MDYKNNKVVVLSGYARGGTNIVWNILQSHPEICSPIYETGEVFDKSLALKVVKLLSKVKIFNFCKRKVDEELFQSKLKNLKHSDNKYISENRLYNKAQIENSILCTKSVNDDIYLTDLLLKTYSNLYFIALSRNGYALAESCIRRGYSAEEAGVVYSDIAQQIERYAEVIPNFKLIKFEDCLKSPFTMANNLFSFLEVNGDQLNKLRLKSKKIIKDNDQHSTKYGKENKKYWFDKNEIDQILDPDINRRQLKRLSDDQIEAFNKEAKDALSFFGYEIC